MFEMNSILADFYIITLPLCQATFMLSYDSPSTQSASIRTWSIDILSSMLGSIIYCIFFFSNFISSHFTFVEEMNIDSA